MQRKRGLHTLTHTNLGTMQCDRSAVLGSSALLNGLAKTALEGMKAVTLRETKN